MTEFSAIYYPYATIRDLSLLKKAVFTFDKVYLIYPTVERDSYKGLRLGRGSDRPSPSMVYDGTQDLIDSGFVEIIEPSRSVEKFYELIVNCYTDDIHDPTFLNIGERAFWYLYKEKVPETILDELNASRFYDLRKEKVPIGLRDYPGFAEMGPEIRMPLAHGASIMISHAIFNSIEKNLTPITNDPQSHQFLERRLERGLQLLNSSYYKRYVDVNAKVRLNKLLHIPDKFVTMAIPDASRLVNLANVREILSFGDAHQNLLRRYRQGMLEMAMYAQKHFIDPDFEDEMVGMVVNKIQPLYDELRQTYRGLPPFSILPAKRGIDSTAIGASYITVIGGKPIPSAAISSRETELSREVALNLLRDDQALTSHNLNYLLHS